MSTVVCTFVLNKTICYLTVPFFLSVLYCLFSPYPFSQQADGKASEYGTVQYLIAILPNMDLFIPEDPSHGLVL